MDSTPPFAALALSLTVPDWQKIGIEPSTAPTDDLQALCDRVTSVLLIRVVAQACPEYCRGTPIGGGPPPLNASSICRTALMEQEPWPEPITDSVVQQVRKFCLAILKGYNEVPYHGCQHATHVVLSVNKLIDMMWNDNEKTKSFGLRQDAMSLTALVFAALIHDVEHMGVPNRQLASEDDELAILYNDESIAENRSLYVGFKEFLKPDYAELRNTLFPNKEDYRRFRKTVVNLVLNTDIASPERTQLAKSKWKEAFESHNHGASSNVGSRSSSFDSNAKEEGDDDDEDDDMLKHVRRSFDDSAAQPTQVHKHVHGRSLSAPERAPESKFRKRLGIRRSMDLTGETLDTYSSHGGDGNNPFDNDDDADELKAAVVMECIMTAADVAHNLQGWDQMVIWSSKLYMELRRAFVQGRGGDASPKWFENQIGFLESYLLPLAQQLDKTGVFSNANDNFQPAGTRKLFAEIVTASRDQWLLEGIEVAQRTVHKGNEAFPFSG